jgi:hypothetical protein
MSVDVRSLAEQQARQAEALSAFSGLNLLHIKRQVALLLQQIGGQGIFDEYTRHDISHIDAMLSMLTECIIPARTQDVMSKADWLIAVLAIYFHDLGMLVTKSEYTQRHQSGFPQYRDTHPFRMMIKVRTTERRCAHYLRTKPSDSYIRNLSDTGMPNA